MAQLIKESLFSVYEGIRSQGISQKAGRTTNPGLSNTIQPPLISTLPEKKTTDTCIFEDPGERSSQDAHPFSSAFEPPFAAA